MVHNLNTSEADARQKLRWAQDQFELMKDNGYEYAHTWWRREVHKLKKRLKNG